jgi:hypothetical protein
VTDDEKKMDAFVKAASQPGARLLIARDVYEALQAWAASDVCVFAALKEKQFTVDDLLPLGTIATVPRCKCGHDPCQPWRHAGWVP